MTYKLFIDDERHPITYDWEIVRSSQEAILAIKKLGMPKEISFDHDLGGEDTSIPFIWYIINEFLDGNLTWPENFKYSVHSQNPIGKENIKKLMDGFLASEIYPLKGLYE